MKKILIILFCIVQVTPVICVTHPPILNPIEPSLRGDMTRCVSDYNTIDSDSDPTKITILSSVVEDTIHISLYFRWDKENIDPTYMTNSQTLHTLDSVMNLRSAEYIDTIKIMAFASPEGPTAYNQQLSERRASSFRQYLLNRYPQCRLFSVLAEGKGENWEGLRSLAEADHNLPGRAEILAIIDNQNLTLAQREARIVDLDGGTIYRDYIYPKYYPKLRSGASLFVVYNPMMPTDIDSEPVENIVVDIPSEPEAEVVFNQTLIAEEVEIGYRYIRPFALKTNLLFDLVTLFNIELEVPIGKHFSLLGEWTFPFWGGLGNRGGVAPVPVYSEKYTLQMLSGGLEVRYWFPRGERLTQKAQRWGDYNALSGWFVGVYAGMGVYDFQFGGDGVQGERFLAAGVSGGFAHPIGKYLHLEYSLGVGYLQTEYKHYTPMDGHKVYEYDGRYTWFGPTKAKVSLVWMPRFRINNNKGGVK